MGGNVTVNGNSKLVLVDLIPSAGAYAPGQVVGTAGGAAGDGGKIPLPGGVRNNIGTGALHSLMMYDNANQKPAMTVLIYAQKPYYNFTDKQVPQSLEGEQTRFLGKINFEAADWETIADSGGDRAVLTIKNAGIMVGVIDPSLGKVALHAVFITRSAATWVGGVTELRGVFGFLRD